MQILRSSTHGMARLLQRNASQLTGQIRQAESEIITGMSVQRPSDDPTAAAQALRLQGLINDQSVYERNSVAAQSLLGQAETAMADAGDLLKRAKELAIAGASESWSSADRQVMATEVEMLRSQLLDLANTRVGTRYIFSGDAYDTEAFDESATYTGGSEEPVIQVSANQTESVGFDGSEVFQGDVDLFAVLEDLQTALEDNDADGVSAVIDDLTDGHEQIVEWRAVVGHSYAVTEDAIDTAGNVEAMLQTELDGLVGIDETEVYLRLAELRTAYEAAMRVGGTSVSGTLFSYL
ncbi:MAG TPA: flagellar hook-associated protein FlgL [Myxococcota bacterium]|nr:flagellar hook-associated protein FlgL [Myxococcota bacterium]